MALATAGVWTFDLHATSTVPGHSSAAAADWKNEVNAEIFREPSRLGRAPHRVSRFGSSRGLRRGTMKCSAQNSLNKGPSPVLYRYLASLFHRECIFAYSGRASLRLYIIQRPDVHAHTTPTDINCPPSPLSTTNRNCVLVMLVAVTCTDTGL